MIRRFALPLTVVMLLAPAAWAQEPTPADIDSARAAFLQGLDLRDKQHDLAAAVGKFKAAYALVPTPRIGFELGRTLQQQGDLVGARAVFVAATQLPVKPQESPEARRARIECQAQANDLERRIPQVSLHIAGTGQIYVDGEALRHEALSVPRHLNPGSHVIQLQVDGDVKAEQTVTLAEGDRKDLTMTAGGTPQPRVEVQGQVQVVQQPPPPPPPLQVDQSPYGHFQAPVAHRSNVATKAALYYTAASLAGLGILPGAFALSYLKDANDACSGGSCSSSYDSNKNLAYGFAIATDVIWATAIICFVAAIVIPSQSSDVAVGLSPIPGGGFIGATGRF